MSIAIDKSSAKRCKRDPIFIVRCPRLDTTILQATLISRSEIFLEAAGGKVLYVTYSAERT